MSSQQRAHVAEVGDRHTDLADLAPRHLRIGVVAGLGRQVEGDRQPRLALGQVGAVELVRRRRGRVARVRPHQPGLVSFPMLPRHVRSVVVRPVQPQVRPRIPPRIRPPETGQKFFKIVLKSRVGHAEECMSEQGQIRPAPSPPLPERWWSPVLRGFPLAGTTPAVWRIRPAKDSEWAVGGPPALDPHGMVGRPS